MPRSHRPFRIPSFEERRHALARGRGGEEACRERGQGVRVPVEGLQNLSREQPFRLGEGLGGGPAQTVEDGGEGGVDVIAGRLPLAATVTNADSNQIRFPKVRDMMLARGKPITRWSAQDLGLDPADLEPTARAAEIDELFVPDRTSSCQFIDGEDGAEKARKLVQKLRELKLL